MSRFDQVACALGWHLRTDQKHKETGKWMLGDAKYTTQYGYCILCKDLKVKQWYQDWVIFRAKNSTTLLLPNSRDNGFTMPVNPVTDQAIAVIENALNLLEPHK